MPKRPPFAAARLPAQFPPGEPCLIGLSGGRDSIALTHWLLASGFTQLILCHLDHGLRPGSAEDAAFAASFARGAGCTFVSERVDTAAFAKRRKLSLEAAARDLRYRFFARVARDRAVPRVFLAHHADDQVETFLLQLLRGAGPGGLAGMSPLSTRRIDGTELLLVRPLLSVWRSEVDAYVARHSLEYREDESNAGESFTRNRVRHIALPALREAFGRDAQVAIWRAAELLRAESECLAAAADGALPMADVLRADDLRVLPLALQRRILLAWLRHHEISDAGFEEVESIRRLLARMHPSKVNLPGARRARRRAGQLFIDHQ